MSRRLRLTKQARQDIRDIVVYSRDAFGPRQARAYHAEIEKTLHTLRRDEGPKLVRRRDEYGAGLRSCRAAGPDGRHVLFFRLRGSIVAVVRILHEAMDFARHLESSDPP